MPTLKITKENWKTVLAYFVATIIPLSAWLLGILPDPVFEHEMKRRDIAHQRLVIEFNRSQIAYIGSLQREIQRSIHDLEQRKLVVPPYYSQQAAHLESRVDALQTDIDTAKIRKLELETLKK